MDPTALASQYNIPRAPSASPAQGSSSNSLSDPAALAAKYGIPKAPSTNTVSRPWSTSSASQSSSPTPAPFGGNIIPKIPALGSIDEKMSDLPGLVGGAASGAYNAAKGIGKIGYDTIGDALLAANHPLDSADKLAQFIADQFTQAFANHRVTVNGKTLEPDALGSLVQSTIGAKGLLGLAGDVPKLLATSANKIAGKDVPPLVTPGQLAGHALNSALTVLTAGQGGLTEDAVKQAVEKGLISEGTGQMLGRIASGIVGKGLESGTAGSGFQAASNLQDGRPITENTGKAFAAGAFVPAELSGLKKVADFAQGTAPSFGRKSLDEANAAIDEGINKGVKPTIAGKGTLAKSEAYKTDARTAIHDIVANKSSLELPNADGDMIAGERLPQTNAELAHAVAQGKERIFNQYDALQKSAGEKGAQVDLKPISGELRTVADNQALQDLNPNIAKYAQEKADVLEKRGAYDTETAQQAVKDLNASLDAFYKNPSYETASKAGVDALIANKLRAGLDDVITKSEGEGYQTLRNAYKAYKTIEADVNHRAQMVARQNKMPLIDFSNIATGAELVKGLATLDPVALGKATVMKSIASYIKRQNSPDANIAKMFKVVDKYHSSQASNSLNATLPTKTPTATEPEISKNDVIDKNVAENGTKVNGAKGDIQKIMTRFDDADPKISTPMDVANEIESILDGKTQLEAGEEQILNAIQKFKDEVGEDFNEFAGRGDTSGAEDAFMSAIEKYLNKK